MFKILKNEEGSVIVIAIIILAVLTLIGVASMRTSNTELQISTNHGIALINFYSAESAGSHGKLWLLGLDLENDTDTASFGPLNESDEPEWFNLSNGSSYTWLVKHEVDADGNILYYGDPDNDYLWEVNTISGMPL